MTRTDQLHVTDGTVIEWDVPIDGFADCVDTHQTCRRQLTRLRDMRIIP